MAAFFMPHVALAPAYHCGPARGYHHRPAPQRRYSPAPRPSFNPFLSFLDDALSELSRDAQRQAQLEKQQRTFRARFDVQETNEGYQVEGEVPGFVQDNIEIEISDENTLKISGSVERKSQPQTQLEPEKMEIDQAPVEATQPTEKAADDAASVKSDTSSRKSYQPTVEDDFEDLGAESTPPSTPSSTSSYKGKEKVTEESKVLETAVAQQPQPQVPAPPQQPEPNRNLVSERSYGSFIRTFNFPVRIDADNVRASLKNGLLSITVPKARAHQPTRIIIQ